MKSNSIRWLPLALAGIISVVLTWFGLMGSAFSQTGWQNPIAVTLIWLLPLLSLPALVTYSLWKKVPPAALWGLPSVNGQHFRGSIGIRFCRGGPQPLTRFWLR